MKLLVKILSLFLIVGLLVSCSSQEEEPGPPGAQKVESKHKNGKLAAQGYFVNDKMNGPWVQWYESGKKEREEHYKDDQLHGRTARWDEAGHLLEEAFYKEGKLDGKKTTWDEKGNVLSVVEYRDGVEVSQAAQGKP